MAIDRSIWEKKLKLRDILDINFKNQIDTNPKKKKIY